ncbi:ATP-binding protein [Sphingobacterium psychroaquaticum]|uniref:Predicted ATPase n=1 Tax=Sphingobacterium psychroaquaticum TaxID=561061 RepID=A0A1X7JW19_9SPHI|nr:ATP-binding protein [Sphingobacterium psychroaquaticum]SMG32444.1 Predicted ATPase [Sphingobacterium psychroaquaticum]
MNRIKRVVINGLWKDKSENIIWDLNNDINILSGINGSGKSTVMDVVSSLMLNRTEILKKIVEEVKIYISDTQFFHYKFFTKNISDIEASAKLGEPLDDLDFKYETLLDALNNEKRKMLETDGENIKSVSFNITKDSSYLKDFRLNTKIDIISTFDNAIIFDDESYDEDVETELDKELYLLQKKYLSYQLNLAKKVQGSYATNPKKVKNTIKNAYSQIELFKEYINDFFREAGKKIDEDKNELSFTLLKSNNPITIYQLSSGEKQLLLILLTVLLQDKKSSIIFMDEPEISLHFDWQKQLINIISTLNPNAQLIIATHSPAMIMEGWFDKVVNIADIKVC